MVIDLHPTGGGSLLDTTSSLSLGGVAGAFRNSLCIRIHASCSRLGALPKNKLEAVSLSLYCTVFILLLMTSQGLHAASSNPNAQPEIPRTAVLEETGDVLKCRGIALHKNFFQDSYMGAFYSQNVVTTPQQALLDVGPRRMLLVFLKPVDNLRMQWEEGIEENNSPEIVQREQISISQFLKSIDHPLRKGDIVVLDYVPNVGTKVTVKGSPKAIIKGNEFYNLILKVWMGRQPPSNKFRKDLFNLS
jgi:hypothetical protein